MKTAKLAFCLAAMVLLFIFSVNNRQEVQIFFLNYHTPALPLFLVIIFIFLLGLLLASLLGTLRFSQMRRKLTQLRRENESLRREREAQPQHAQGGSVS